MQESTEDLVRKSRTGKPSGSVEEEHAPTGTGHLPCRQDADAQSGGKKVFDGNDGLVEKTSVGGVVTSHTGDPACCARVKSEERIVKREENETQHAASLHWAGSVVLVVLCGVLVGCGNLPLRQAADAQDGGWSVKLERWGWVLQTDQRLGPAVQATAIIIPAVEVSGEKK